MSTLDLIGSTILGAAVIAAVIGLNLLLADSSNRATAELTSQQTMVEFQRMIQWDLDKIGYGTAAPVPILAAKADTLRFIADLKNDGIPDTLRYYRRSVTQQGVNTLLLYRVVENTKDTMKMNIGLSRFDLTYFDSTGASTSTPSLVRGIKIAARAESRIALQDSVKAGAYWEQTFYPRNINVPR